MIRVLLFAHLREQLNRPEILIEKKEMSVGQLREALQKNGMLAQASAVMVAVNEEFAADEEIIRDGDVVALIPPVSGG
ncbi:molybdopterin converting factor subunit 1 [Heyndrickxia acidiproducens]|uniref:molybdopterin converting factor subunit 1 n=1 Tax=Heyndrickxia acidiproducens TaxID=1121084 RepID=UPI000371A2FB|nr:molybdopterin converting factor subunit 1 [Heyndrickxia acidiproducens]